MKLFSYRDRPVHLGPFPLEGSRGRTPRRTCRRCRRCGARFDDPDPRSLAHAMARFMAMFDTVRDGAVTHGRPRSPTTRPSAPAPEGRRLLLRRGDDGRGADRGGALAGGAHSATPASTASGRSWSGPAEELRRRDRRDLCRRARRRAGRTRPVRHHTHALVILVDYARDPEAGEPGTEWIGGTQASARRCCGQHGRGAGELPAHAGP
jgi:hypothetical protein